MIPALKHCVPAFAFILLCMCCIPVQANRRTYLLNTHWGFRLANGDESPSVVCPDSMWTPVSLPHIMQLVKKNCGGNHIYRGDADYRRVFHLDAKDVHQKIFIDFEGVMKNCEIYVNGRPVDLYRLKPAMAEAKRNAHYGGYLGFRVDVTPYVHFGADNCIQLHVMAGDDTLTP